MLIHEFNRLVNDEIKKGTIIKEEVLFECLQESFGKLAYSDIVHGYKGHRLYKFIKG